MRSDFIGVSWHSTNHRWQATLSVTNGQGRRKQYTKQAPTELACVLAYNTLVRQYAPNDLDKLHAIAEDGVPKPRMPRRTKRKRRSVSQPAAGVNVKRRQTPSAAREVIDLTASPAAQPTAPTDNTGDAPFSWQAKLRAKRSAAAKGKRRTKYTAAEDGAITRFFAAAVAEGAGLTKRAVWDAVRDAMHALAEDFPQRRSEHYRDHYERVLSAAAVAKKAAREAERDDVVYLLVVDLDPPRRPFSAHEDAALLAWARRERGASAASLAPLDAWHGAARSSALRTLGRAPRELWRQYWFAHAAYVGETPTLAARLRQHNCEQGADACVTRRVLPLLRSVEPRARWRHALTVTGFPRCRRVEEGVHKKIPRKVFGASCRFYDLSLRSSLLSGAPPLTFALFATQNTFGFTRSRPRPDVQGDGACAREGARGAGRDTRRCKGGSASAPLSWAAPWRSSQKRWSAFATTLALRRGARGSRWSGTLQMSAALR
jgi:hypothetical protein